MQSDPPPRPAPGIRISSSAWSWATAMNVDPERLAEASGVPRAVLEAGTLGYDDALALWDGLERLTGDPHVGLHAGERFQLDQMGVVGPAMAHAPTVAALLDGLVRILPHLMVHVRFERVQRADAGGLSYRTPARRSRHGPDAIFAAILTVARRGTGQRLIPASVEVEVAAPAEPGEHLRVFGVLPTWGAPANTLLFHAADLERPLGGAAPALAELLVERAGELIEKDGGRRTTFDLELERSFWASDPHGGATLEATARAMKVSPRTLQRRLAEAGMTFQSKRASFLMARAKELLDDRARSVEQVADALGYGSRTAFERAFQRWHGRTPAEHRRERRR